MEGVRVGGGKAGLGQGYNGRVSHGGGGATGEGAEGPALRAQSPGCRLPAPRLTGAHQFVSYIPSVSGKKLTTASSSDSSPCGLISLYLTSPMSQVKNSQLPHPADSSPCTVSVVGFQGKDLATGRHCWGAKVASHQDSPGMVCEHSNFISLSMGEGVDQPVV